MTKIKYNAQFHVKISDEYQKKLQELRKYFGWTNRKLLETAIDKMYFVAAPTRKGAPIVDTD